MAADDAGRHFYDQNVMCMRSGLVIKTAPVGRPSSTSSFQTRPGAPRGGDLASVSGAVQAPSSPAAVPQQPAAEAGGAEAGDATTTAGGSWKSGGGGASRSNGGGGGVMRTRSIDFLSIVTRFQLARRARAVQLGVNMADDQDWLNNTAQRDFITHDSARF